MWGVDPGTTDTFNASDKHGRTPSEARKLSNSGF